ncbi:MAG: DNA polymerase Y family protein, partial [Phycisphaerae bacterium]|nr:DNA polymerase Y family protein [Phycisphaerae bacterium]
MRRVLCLHLPYLSTDRVRRDGRLGPGDADRPLVLTRRVGASVFVAQRCARAQAGGVEIGASAAQAQATLPDAIAVPEDAERDRQLLWQLARWALRFSPSVQPLEPNLLLVDVTGCERLFGGERNIAQQAVGGLTRLGFGARAAIADTIGAAYALASAETAGCVVVPPGQSSAHLAPLPPATLRIDAQTQERLEALGVRTIGDLLTLPRSSLPARFGRDLLRRLRQALGEKHEPLVAYEDRPPPFTRVAFEAPVSEPRAVHPVAGQMLDELSQQVQQRELGVRTLELIVYFEQVPPTVVTVNLSRASQAWEHIRSLLQGRLEYVDLSPGVSGMMLAARHTSRWQPHQGDLFEARDPAADEVLGCLVDRLASRLGHAAIVRPQLVDDHQPEFAFRYVSVTAAGCAPAGSNGVTVNTRQ